MINFVITFMFIGIVLSVCNIALMLLDSFLASKTNIKDKFVNKISIILTIVIFIDLVIIIVLSDFI